ncbi:MAG: hypothetical protein JO324_01250 [Candidatus Eremiobacteraeota bacterium]|nr:hypothetical protein [Candidatus Eremiobacteraeota bacterium]
MSDSFLQRLSAAVDNEAARDIRAQRAAEMIREARGYRWVGIYDVGDEEISIVGSTGAPPRGRPSYSVPILGAESGVVIGTLDMESDRIEAFSDADARFLEECAETLRPLYD